MNRLLAALVLATLSAAAAAQSSAPATSAPAAPAAAVAPHACPKPGEHPGRLASDNQRRAWVRNVNGYLDCLKKYVSEHQSIATPLLAQAKPHMDAANATIDEYNKAVAQFKDEQEKNN